MKCGTVLVAVSGVLMTAFVGCSLISAHSHTYDVPRQFPTIQACIDSAVPWASECLVAPGTYNERIDFNGKAVLVRSSDGPDVTTIDGTGLGGSVVTCIAGEAVDTVLEGFTITGGIGRDLGDGFRRGGGMYISASSPTVRDCTFIRNVADGGGGMYNDNASHPIVTGCTFAENTADIGGGMRNQRGSNPVVSSCTFAQNKATGTTGVGGGMANRESSPRLTNCTFIENTTTEDGGGMHNLLESSPTVTDCTFTENTADVHGGGMYSVLRSSPTLTNCTFSKNAAHRGGGMGNSNSSNTTVTNCTFIDNSTTGDGADGGGMYNFASSSPTVTNCLFHANSASLGGGMYNAVDSSPTVTNCTFGANMARLWGGGLYTRGGSPTVVNCILWENTAELYGAQVFDEGSSSSVLTYCNVQDGTGELWFGEGCTDSHPLFVQGPAGCYYLSQVHAGQNIDSPCINAGSDTATNLGLDMSTTASDETTDAGVADIGYHYPTTGEPLTTNDDACNADDSFEENDLPGNAAVIEGEESTLYVVEALAMDDDWYRVEADGPGSVSARVEFEHAAGDIDVFLLNGKEVTLDSSESESDQEFVTGVALDGEFLIHVFSYRDGENPYQMEVSWEPAPELGVCTTGIGSCFDEHTDAGCHVEECCIATCQADASCCTTAWDESCVALASVACPSAPTDETLVLALGQEVTMELVLVPAGVFVMGTDSKEYWGLADSRPVHRRTIAEDFYIGRYEVTQAQWRAVMGDNPSYFTGCDECPVEQISWGDAVEFCDTLSSMTGHAIRLPSEAEWEYACRAGTNTEYPTSDSAGDLADYAWYRDNSGSRTHEVGSKLPNPWGLHDMRGNVFEYCEDIWHEDYTRAPSDGSAWTKGDDPAHRVIRGGAWINGADYLRAALRRSFDTGHPLYHIGFRVAARP